jgi:hypothetical protein
MVSLAIFKRRVPVTHLLLNPGVAPALVHNVAATPETFTFLHATSDGARIYEVRRGGSGPLIRRAFREEQLRGATLEVRLGGRAIPLRIALNGADLARTEGGATVVRVPVPGDRIWSEANQVEIAALDGTTTVDLEDVTALPPPGVAAAFCR